MRHSYIGRKLETEVRSHLRQFAAVAVLGPRQCGKSTLARHVIKKFPDSLYLDLELPSDLRKLDDPELFFGDLGRRLVCLDEIQRKPDLFPVLRALIDERGRAGQLLILGSASRDLIRQSSETLAGRIAYLHLTPFTYGELQDAGVGITEKTYWLRGGFPESVLAGTESKSVRWRRNFLRTFVERDIAQLGPRIPVSDMDRFWRVCAHYSGQLLNQSEIAKSLGISHPTVRSYVDLLVGAFVARLLPPLRVNLKKRLVKSPRLYVRDSGLLHSLHEVDTFEDLMGHPVCGSSWEGMVIENIVSLLPDWQAYFYRTARGAEIDLVLQSGRRRIAFECKASSAPKPERGFWTAMKDLDIERAWIVAPVKEAYPIADNVRVIPLSGLDEARAALAR